MKYAVRIRPLLQVCQECFIKIDLQLAP
jgi:hypothetical protein